MVELVLLKVEPAHQGSNSAIAWIQSNKSRLHFGQLGNSPPLVTFVHKAHDRPRMDLDRRCRFGGQARCHRSQTVALDRNGFAILPNDHHFSKPRLQDHSSDQITVVRMLGQNLIDCVIARDFGRRQLDACFRPAVALATVVGQHPVAQGLIGNPLRTGVQTGCHGQSAGVGFVAVLRHHRLAHHFGSELGMHLLLVVDRLQNQLLRHRSARFVTGNIAIGLHALNDVELANRARLGLEMGLYAEGAFGKPASMAASATVTSLSCLPK